MDAALRDELVAMAAEDQRVRAQLAADGSLFEGYHAAMQAVHDKNAARLTAIIHQHGWPGRRLVGDEGARAAWLVVQHAIAHPDLQRRGLVLLQEAAAQCDVPAAEAAMLEDRIAYFQGRPQKYGNEHHWDEHGVLAPWIIEDEANVEERRRQVGLPPLADVTRRIREDLARNAGKLPTNWKERDQKFREWARAVGWRA